MAYIKTHSNYVLKKRHKFVNGDGTVFERDITTIGGVNQFAPGQIPMYRSGNFIITVNNENNASRHIKGNGWAENPSGVTWTERVIAENYDQIASASDTNYNILFNKDFYKFTDFAYYGSLSNMVKVSLDEIVSMFPGELYFTGIKKDESGNTINRPISVSYTVYENGQEIKKRLGGDNWYLVSNPFGIDIHSTEILPDSDIAPDRFFMNGNYMFYDLILDGELFGGKRIGFTYEGISMNAISYIDYEFGNDGSVTLINTNKYLPIELTFLDGGNKVKAVVESNGRVRIDSSYRSSDVFTVDGFSEDHHEVKVGVEGASVEFDVVSERVYEITGFELISASLVYCKGDQIGTVFIRGYDDSLEENEEIELKIGAWIGDNYEIYYLIEDNGDIGEAAAGGFHIRPNESQVDLFYLGLTDFERILMNRKTDPLYKATFEVTTETENGYVTKLESFVYPVGLGGYNIGSYGEAYSNYVNRLVNATQYYDERYCDNLYRSMTHESIKNLDWSFQREERPDLVELYGEGENRISSFLRIAGAEFDNIKQYIDNIPTVYSVTYRKNGNIPDYFITDSLELDGWDLRLTCPFRLNETIVDENGDEIDVTGIPSEEDELNNELSGSPLTRNFSQDNGVLINPYSLANISEEKRNGYYLGCLCESGSTVFDVSVSDASNRACLFDQSDDGSDLNAIAEPFGDRIPFDVESYREIPILSVIPASGTSDTYVDCKGIARNIIRQYSDKVKYTYGEANMEFMRRLKINSRALASSKGTYNGIEMMLSLFGLRSKRWYDASMTWKKEQLSTGKDSEWTYHIDAEPELAELNAEENDVVYSVESYAEKDTDNLSFPFDFDVKEYTLFTPRIEDIWYPKRDDYMISWCNSTKLIGYTDTDGMFDYEFYNGLPVKLVTKEDVYIDDEGKETENECFAAKTTDGDLVHARYLYPMFDKNRTIDGNPYYQMLGGWERMRPIKFNEENKVLHYKVEDLFKETVQNVKKVQTLEDLLSLPTQSLFDGQIYYVNYLIYDLGIIDGKAYELNTDENGYEYMSFEVIDGGVEIGDAYFNNYVTVSTPYMGSGNTVDITLQDKTDGFEIRVYVVDGTVSVFSNTDTISSFVRFKDGKYKDGDNYTNYFRINDRLYPNELSENGWEQLTTSDKDYYKLNSVTDYFKGNNPHNGKLQYDCGHEYLEYFHQLFKYAEDENVIDSTCYDDEDIVKLNGMRDIDYTKPVYGVYDSEYDLNIPFGFKNLIHPNHDDKNYDRYLNEDDKIHYFGNYISNEIGAIAYDQFGKTGQVGHYDITDIEMFEGGDKYGSNIRIDKTMFPYTIDNVTNQIVNTKRMEILFYLHSKDYMSKEYLEEVKYYQDIILPYVEQMIPSSMIWTARFITMGEEEYLQDPISEADLTGLDVVVTLTEVETDDDGNSTYDINVRLVGGITVKKKVYGYDEPLTVTADVDMDISDIAEIEIDDEINDGDGLSAWISFEGPRLTLVQGLSLEELKYEIIVNLSRIITVDGAEFDVIPVLKRRYSVNGTDYIEEEQGAFTKSFKAIGC